MFRKTDFSRPLRRIYQLLLGYQIFARYFPSFTRKLFGEVTVDELNPKVILPEHRVAANSTGSSDFVEETYKWPVSTVVTPFEYETSFLSGAFRFVKLDKAVIAGDGRVFDANRRFIVDSAASHLNSVFHPGKFQPIPTRIINGVVLNLNWWPGTGSIYHWNRDVLSRAFVLTKFADQPITLVFPSPMTPFQKHAASQLVKLFPLCQIQTLELGEWVQVDECIVPSAAPYKRGSGYLHPEVAEFVRKVNVFEVAESGSEITVAFVSRSKAGHRRIRNENVLLSEMRSHMSVQVFHMEDFDCPSQMAIVQRVRVLVGAFGAGLTYANFTKGSGLVEIHNGDSRETHFATFALSRNIPYAQIQGGMSDAMQDFELDELARAKVTEAVMQFLSV